MKKVSELLRSINSYPIPANVIAEAGIKYDVDTEADATPEILQSPGYQLCKADIYEYLASAPNISQNGISFSFSQDQREMFLSISSSIKKEQGVEDPVSGQGYGYMGEDF